MKLLTFCPSFYNRLFQAFIFLFSQNNLLKKGKLSISPSSPQIVIKYILVLFVIVVGGVNQHMLCHPLDTGTI